MWKLLLGLESGPSLLQQEGGRDLVSLLRNAARGRRPLCLITPCRGTRSNPISSQVLLGGPCHGHNRGLLLGPITSILLGGILVGNGRLGFSQAANVARIIIRGRTNKKEPMQIPITTLYFVKHKESVEDMFYNS